MLAPAPLLDVRSHQCPWCRSDAVAPVELHDGALPAAAGRCLDCGREAPLVPFGLAC